MSAWCWVHTRPLAVAAGIALISVTFACDGALTEEASHTARDSAGIQIVESTAPAWREGNAWRSAALQRWRRADAQGRTTRRGSDSRYIRPFRS
jgi:hypothetical protein